jgi:hypothetical protein
MIRVKVKVEKTYGFTTTNFSVVALAPTIAEAVKAVKTRYKDVKSVEVVFPLADDFFAPGADSSETRIEAI